MKIFATLMALAICLTAPAWAETPSELLSRIDLQRAVPDMDFVLTITSYQGEKQTDTGTLWGWVKLSAGGSKTLLTFVDPAATRGRKMLMDGPTVYLLFPKTRNPIRLTPLQVLLGQSSNGDVARTAFSTDYEVTAQGEETLEGTSCWTFDLAARPGRQATAYQRVQLWVKKEGLRPLAADFYAAGDQKLKHTIYGDYRAVGDKTVAFRLDISDGTDPSKHTVLQYSRVGHQALPDGAFRKDYLEGWSPEAPQ